jgi:hypothetical protein
VAKGVALSRGKKTLIRVDRPQRPGHQEILEKEVGKRPDEKRHQVAESKRSWPSLHRTFGLTAPFNATPRTNLARRSSILVLRLSPATGIGTMNHPGGRGNPNEIRARSNTEESQLIGRFVSSSTTLKGTPLTTDYHAQPLLPSTPCSHCPHHVQQT